MRTPFLIAVLLLVIASGFVWYGTRNTDETPYEIESHATSTYSVSYEGATTDDIVLAAPTPGAIVGESFLVSGEARGTWYFEASFPIEVVAADGTVLVQIPGEAQSDWMTTEFVPFATVVNVGDYSGAATLILRRDNPSGLPEHDASISLPITFEDTVDMGTSTPEMPTE